MPPLIRTIKQAPVPSLHPGWTQYGVLPDQPTKYAQAPALDDQLSKAYIYIIGGSRTPVVYIHEAAASYKVTLRSATQLTSVSGLDFEWSFNMDRNSRRSRIFSPGGAFFIACLFGLLGIATGTVLWLAGFSVYLVVLAYVAVPAAMVFSLYLLSKM